MASDPDAALMLAFQGGDESAFRALFGKYGRAMVGYCYRYVKDLARAEELAQDVFLKLHRSAGRYQPTARFKTFLYRIASNHCLNELRRPEHAARLREVVREDDEGDPARELERVPGGVTPEEAALAASLARDVERLLAGLPEKQRAAFVLARLEGLSYDEVAEVLDTTLAAVKSLVHRATVAAAAALAHHAAPPAREESR